MSKKQTYPELDQKFKEQEKRAATHKGAVKELRENKEDYRALITKMLNGFALHEIRCDEDGKPRDYRFLEVNSAFEEMTGLKAGEIINKSVLEVLPQTEPYWINTFGNVALTGESIRFQNYAKEFDRYFEVLSYSPKKGQFATVFTDVTDRIKAENALKESEEKYRTLTENAPIGIYYNDFHGNFIYGNKKAEKIIGYKREELIGKNFLTLNLLQPEDIGRAADLLAENTAGKKTGPDEVVLNKKDGSTVTVEINTEIVTVSGKKVVLGMVQDITKRKKVEKALQEAHDEMEKRVDERTQELSLANEKMRLEIEERIQAEKALQVKEKELKQQADHLEKVNTALKVLIDHRDEEKTRLEKAISLNMQKLVMPYLEKLDSGVPKEHLKTYLDIIRSNLEDIASPFSSRLSFDHLNLTPTEIQIADLVRHGYASKDISSNLNISIDAVSFHRKSIRKKLGLTNKKSNLRSYLQQFPE